MWLLVACVQDPDDPASAPGALSAETLAFPTANPGEHVDALLRVRNPGEAPVTLAGVRVDDPAGVFTVGGWSEAPIRPGGELEVPVRFTAAGEGSWTADVTLTGAGGETGSTTLEAHAGWGDLVVSALDLDLGFVSTGERVEAAVTVENGGVADLVLESLTLIGAGGVFEVFDRGPFATPGAVLAPGATGEVRLAWEPTDDGCDEASLLVRTDDPESPDTTITLAGCADTPGVDATLVLNVDDYWEAWIDGEPFTAADAGYWAYTDTVELELPPGEHVLAVHGTDTGGPGGFIAGIWYDGEWAWGSGEGWGRVSASPPGSGWEAPGYDDSGWEVEQLCADTSSWGSSQTGGVDAWGARWVWSSTDCYTPVEAWLRYTFTVE